MQQRNRYFPHEKYATPDNETVADLLQRLDASLGNALADNTVVHEVLPEIKRRRGPIMCGPNPSMRLGDWRSRL